MKILGLCGSLRKASYNRAALLACEPLLPAGVCLELADISDLPMYDQDVFDAGIPSAAQRVRAQIAASDGVLIASSEYNFSLSAVLKNAIDWASRAPSQVFQDKPVAIISATTGPLGGARVQYDIRRILGPLGAMILAKPEVFIGNAANKFDGDGRLTDEQTRQFLRAQLAAFEVWAKRMQHSLTV